MKKLVMAVVALWVVVLATGGAGEWTAFRAGEVWRDTRDQPINRFQVFAPDQPQR